MPTYGPLGTTVSLYTWEAEGSQDALSQGDVSQSCEVERITEDIFDDQGLDFLGPSSVPFFLVNAGQDLFSPAAQGDNDDTAAANAAANIRRVDSTAVLADSTSPAVRSRLPSSPLMNDHYDSTESDNDTTISSLNSSMFERSPEFLTGHHSDEGAADAGSGETTSRPKRNSNKNHKSIQASPLVIAKKPLSKPITSPKPLKLQVDLSNKSFMHSLITNTQEDICISVFYNGEFVSSRVFRWNTFNSGQKSEGGRPIVSGRRIGTTVEVPWIIKPRSNDVPTSFVSPTLSTAEATWHKIGHNLLVEADEWGRDGKFDMFRNPVGEYLEHLSKIQLPKKAWPLGGENLSIGVVDVVIGLGKTINHPYKCLRQPQRKLTQGRCGNQDNLFVVPKELSSINLNQMIASFQDEEDQKDNRAPKNAQKTGTRPKTTVSRTSTSQSTTGRVSGTVVHSRGSRAASVASSIAGMDPMELTSPSESVFTGAHDGSTEPHQSANIPHPVSLLKVSTVSSTPAVSNSVELPSPGHANQPPPPKSKLPKNIPQKRYRGSTPPAKVEVVNHLSVEHASHATRSRTSLGSAGSLDAISPAASLLQSSQEPTDSFRKPPPHRQRVKSQPATGPVTPVHKSISFGLDGVNDDYYEIRHASTSFTRSLGSPLRQLGSTEMNQSYREHTNFGFDGTEDEPKSTKRKRASLEPSVSEGASKTKVARIKAKGRNDSSSSTLLQLSSTGSAPQAEIRAFSPVDEPPNPTQQISSAARKPRSRNTLSDRELAGLFEPHKPSIDLNTSFGHAFTESSKPSQSTRSSRLRQKLVPPPTSSTPPLRVTATVKDRSMLIVKGIEPNEIPKYGEKVQVLEATAPDSVSLMGDDKVVPNEKVIEAIATVSSSSSRTNPAPAGRSRVLRSSKAMDIDVAAAKSDPAMENVIPRFQSSQSLPLQSNSQLYQPVRKDTFSPDFQKLTNDVNSVPEPDSVIDDTYMSTRTSRTTPKEPYISSTIVMSAAANKKENVRPSTTSSRHRSTLPEQTSFKTPENVLEKAKSCSSFGPAIATALSVKVSNGQEARKDATEITEKLVGVARILNREVAAPGDVGSMQTGTPENNLKGAVLNGEASKSAETHLAPNLRKPSAKKLPLTKFKTTIFTNTPVEPQTPSNQQSKAKPDLTIQSGLANTANRLYSESSTGLKSPTPRSDTFLTTQASGTPCARASTRAITMPRMLDFTPQTPSNRLLAEMSSFPAPAHVTKETRINPPRRSLYDSPINSPALRPIKEASTPIPIDLTKTPDIFTTPGMASRYTTRQRLEQSSVTSPGDRVANRPKATPQRHTEDEASRRWRPTEICNDSILSYVDEKNNAGLPGLRYDKVTETMCRTIKTERESVFRTSGILMGVRYVLGLGSETTKKH